MKFEGEEASNALVLEPVLGNFGVLKGRKLDVGDTATNVRQRGSERREGERKTHPLDLPLTLCSENEMSLSSTGTPSTMHATRISSSEVHCSLPVVSSLPSRVQARRELTQLSSPRYNALGPPPPPPPYAAFWVPLPLA